MNSTKRFPSPLVSFLPIIILICMLVATISTFGSDSLNGGSQVSLLVTTAVCIFIGMAFYRIPWKDYELAITNNISGVATAVIILLIILIPFTRALVGTILGATAALPSLIFASAPFFARLCVTAFLDVDKGTIEASRSMGATNWQIITKVLLPEALPAIVSGIAVTAISLIGYTAMAGAIGAGGLGDLAYVYGFSRRNNPVLYTSTAIIVLIVFAIQWIGDAVVKRIDKR